MIVDFDPAKDAINRAKHGVSLAFGVRVFEDREMSIVPTVRIGDEEERFKAIGLIDGKLWTAIHVWRGAVVRLISVRRSNVGEQRDYDRDSGGPE
ncbi:BrnT family toxin [Sphingomonas oligophenolica]|uniref:BrnT family toxin n=1 Tax=Sphingomonas oligophenolica TaxID=301154 RepID=A0A502CNG1_9SPHN|nr:BrnT family toxin [Sphingomonas oligophenolica]TPG13679.1 BrnT family toxin [Sphingomonas oligophenolica]